MHIYVYLCILDKLFPIQSSMCVARVNWYVHLKCTVFSCNFGAISGSNIFHFGGHCTLNVIHTCALHLIIRSCYHSAGQPVGCLLQYYVTEMCVFCMHIHKVSICLFISCMLAKNTSRHVFFNQLPHLRNQLPVMNCSLPIPVISALNCSLKSLLWSYFYITLSCQAKLDPRPELVLLKKT